MPETKKSKGKYLLRQRKLANNLSGKVSLKEAAIQAGYSESYADTARITKTDSWQQLMEKYIPDKLLSKKHKQILGAENLERFVFPNAMSDEEIKATIRRIQGAKLIKIQRNPAWARAYFTYPDFKIQKEGVDLGYRVKGKFAPERFEAVIASVEVVKYTEKPVETLSKPLETAPEQVKTT